MLAVDAGIGMARYIAIGAQGSGSWYSTSRGAVKASRWSVECRPGPCEAFGREDFVEQEDERREQDQRHIERRPHLHEECQVVRAKRDRGREDEAAGPRVGRGARVRDHEEREDQERA